jgi:transposase-like protein
MEPDAPIARVITPLKKREKTTTDATNECHKDFTIRIGTIFHRSHIPLHKWLYAMYLIVTARKGISSLQLSKEIGIGQNAAWFLLQRIRTACGTK